MKIYSDLINTRAVWEAHRDIEGIAPSCNVDAERRGRRIRYSLDVTMTGFGVRHIRHRNTGKHGANDYDMAATWMDLFGESATRVTKLVWYREGSPITAASTSTQTLFDPQDD